MAETPDFIARMERLLQHFHLSASALADAIGVQRSGISHLLSGRNKPGLDFILKLSERFPEVNLYWLLKGEEPFLKEDRAPAVVHPAKESATPAFSTQLAAKNEQIIVLHPDGTFERYVPK